MIQTVITICRIFKLYKSGTSIVDRARVKGRSLSKRWIGKTMFVYFRRESDQRYIEQNIVPEIPTSLAVAVFGPYGAGYVDGVAIGPYEASHAGLVIGGKAKRPYFVHCRGQNSKVEQLCDEVYLSIKENRDIKPIINNLIDRVTS